jgi:hypothetical protein
MQNILILFIIIAIKIMQVSTNRPLNLLYILRKIKIWCCSTEYANNILIFNEKTRNRWGYVKNLHHLIFFKSSFFIDLDYEMTSTNPHCIQLFINKLHYITDKLRGKCRTFWYFPMLYPLLPEFIYTFIIRHCFDAIFIWF